MPRVLAVILLVIWILPWSITMLGVGFSEGALLSPSGLWRDILALSPGALLRVIGLFILFFPLALIWWIIFPWRVPEKPR